MTATVLPTYNPPRMFKSSPKQYSKSSHSLIDQRLLTDWLFDPENDMLAVNVETALGITQERLNKIMFSCHDPNRVGPGRVDLALMHERLRAVDLNREPVVVNGKLVKNKRTGAYVWGRWGTERTGEWLPYNR
ncbi:hypothetical protein COCMIDRAFT_7178 [Bipolaris oryzae ATCC 44560]|uniref:Uncharacterized protein n=1 Tax=Bipolaris oryzae ATCC 44560 TaxID=930090 RepID=W6Z0Z6_COCMI|nr:uncharacterized protein COCMIDRAFT_7178 [Bipolaris oryzae ATCC 44560]EUC43358.1 hypothetical protein COCMIDRAFT_7178 [Bipolaris oryzae ATCC 44560]